MDSMHFLHSVGDKFPEGPAEAVTEHAFVSEAGRRRHRGWGFPAAPWGELRTPQTVA